MSFKNEAISAWQEEEEKRQEIQAERDAEDQEWIIEELHRKFPEAMENAEEITRLSCGQLMVDGILFRAVTKTARTYLQMEADGHWHTVRTLSDIGRYQNGES